MFSQLVKHLLDRNTCLLPAYFGLNGVNKFFYEDKPNPHYVSLPTLPT